MSPLVGNSDGLSGLYSRNCDDDSAWRYRCRLVVGSGNGSSKRSTLLSESMVLMGGGWWVARGRIWWALSVGTRGWRSVDDVAGF
ncbi:hypothetical protein FH972_009868 [Carpinus fangiana]|uniref:Uncharacterized protein n=1 Tax=Carpinus fangiana TaxID=176857 RepID=A0A660KLI7_9ROSI|nr:hypothetical protein FH972_009868 [Carpinus fangiana]